MSSRRTGSSGSTGGGRTSCLEKQTGIIPREPAFVGHALVRVCRNKQDTPVVCGRFDHNHNRGSADNQTYPDNRHRRRCQRRQDSRIVIRSSSYIAAPGGTVRHHLSFRTPPLDSAPLDRLFVCYDITWECPHDQGNRPPFAANNGGFRRLVDGGAVCSVGSVTFSFLVPLRPPGRCAGWWWCRECPRGCRR